ncbi:MAG: hypothetical protein AAF525_04200 [Pseudomonadota bacterium]
MSKDDTRIPTIAPHQDDVVQRQKTSRPGVARQSSFNGLLVFVIVVMAIMMGIGGYTLWQVQQKLETANVLLARGQENVQALDERLAATGTDVSKTLRTMQDEIKTNFSEIDKLWAVSYRTNRPDIATNKKDIGEQTRRVSHLDDQMATLLNAVSDASVRISTVADDMVDIQQSLTDENAEVLTEVALVRGQVQDVADILGANQRALSAINQRLDDVDAAVESINRFRSQLNERMVELERSAAGG